MYRLILVPWDGSSIAEQAIPLAVGLAKRDGAAVQIVRVHEPLAGAYLDRSRTYTADLDQDLMAYVRDDLDAAVRRVAEKTGLRPESVLLKGPIAETIARQTSASSADLLVMTTRARGPLGRVWFGSVADELARKSRTPILFVRPIEPAPDLGQRLEIRRLTIALDGSELAEQALEPALSLGGAEESEYTLLRVTPTIVPVEYDQSSKRVSGLRTSLVKQLSELKAAQEAEAKDYLERLAERLRARSLTVFTHVVAHEQPALAILEAASNHKADAIAIATRGQGGFKRLFVGSVADKVLRGATIPILICPPVESPVGIS
jgi:nucleotide-binding universal stress UspA family protein